MHRAIKIRLDPTSEQATKLAQVMGCSRWWWNYALNLCITTYRKTGKGIGQIALYKELPKLKKRELNSQNIKVITLVNLPNILKM